MHKYCHLGKKGGVELITSKCNRINIVLIFPFYFKILNPRTVDDALSAKLTKWSNTLKQFVVKLPTNCLSVFDHFVGLALKGLRKTVLISFNEYAENILLSIPMYLQIH